MARTNYKHRRGLSSVIGAVFMILVMVAALNLTLWTLQQQDRVTQTVIDKTNQNLNKLNEDIGISDIKISGNKLNMTVSNAGATAATVKSIYVINETAKQRYAFDTDFSVDGRDSEENVGQSLPLYIKSDTKYSIRLITDSGNTATTSITPLSSVALEMSLFIIPPTVTPTGSNVTVLFAVTNNLTDSVLGTDVTPWLDYDPIGCTEGPGCELIPKETPDSAYLKEGNTVLFKWVYEVDMPDLSNIFFNASLVGAKQGNYVTEMAHVKKIDESNVSESSTLVVFSDLVQKPEIFLIAPGPYGEASGTGDSNLGLWGVNVVNPTELTMEVYRVVFTLYNTEASSSNKIIAANCHSGDDNPVYPNVEGEWTCANLNKLEWKRLGGDTIPPYGVKSYMDRVEPSGIASDEASFLITATVFTNMGQFAKTGFASSMKNGNDVLANVYFTNPGVTEANARQEANINGSMTSVQDGTNDKLFRIVISDFDDQSSTEMSSGLRLVVNVPKEYEDVQPLNHAQFTESSYEFEDGAVQIVYTLNAGEDIGDSSSGESKIVEFTADVPTVTSTKVYIIYALLDGETAGAFSVSAFGQLAAQVIP